MKNSNNMNSGGQKDFDFFKFDKSDCIRLLKEIGELESSTEILTQMKIDKLNQYRRLMQGEIIWQSSTQYLDLIGELLVDELDLNLNLFSNSLPKFSIIINEKLKVSSECAEMLMVNSIILTPSQVGREFSEIIIEIANLSLSHDNLNANQDEILRLLSQLSYLNNRVLNLIDTHLDNSDNSIE